MRRSVHPAMPVRSARPDPTRAQAGLGLSLALVRLPPVRPRSGQQLPGQQLPAQLSPAQLQLAQPQRAQWLRAHRSDQDQP